MNLNLDSSVPGDAPKKKAPPPGPFRRVAEAFRLSRRLMKVLGPHLREQKGAIAGAIVVSVLALGLRVAQPWPIKWVFDLISNNDSEVPWAMDLGSSGLSIFCALYLMISLLAGLSEYGQMMILGGLTNRSVFGLRDRLLVHVLGLPLAFHERRNVGELLTRIVYDIRRLKRGLLGLLLRGFRSVLLFLATVAVLFWIDATLACVVLACGVSAGGAMIFRGGVILEVAKKSRKKEGKVATLVEENLHAIRELQTYRASGEPDPRYVSQNAKSLRSEQKLRRLEAGLLFFVESVLAVAICLVIWLGTRGVTEGRLTPGSVVLFLTYMLHLYRPFTQFARQASKGGRTLACAERLLKILEREPAVTDLPGAVPAPRFSGEIRFEGVTVRADDRRRGGRQELLREVSFRVEGGQRVAVVGPNGAGKSTVLRHIVRLFDPDEGTILVDGRNVREYTLQSLRDQISVVYQDAVLIGLTVRENIALGHSDASEERIQEVARRGGAAGLIEGLPEQYDTVIRQRGRLFSNGERQSIALARALLRDGRIWLLDEPTTGLDAAAVAHLEESLLDGTRGRTTFWVTHRLEIASKLDRVLFLEEGRLRFFGPPEEFERFLDGATRDEVFLKELEETK